MLLGGGVGDVTGVCRQMVTTARRCRSFLHALAYVFGNANKRALPRIAGTTARCRKCTGTTPSHMLFIPKHPVVDPCHAHISQELAAAGRSAPTYKGGVARGRDGQLYDLGFSVSLPWALQLMDSHPVGSSL